MYRRPLIRTLIAAGWLCALSCALVVDTSDVDEGCGPERKLCAGKCVDQSAHAYGCTPKDCDPCRLTNAIPRCQDGACVVDSCLFGFDCPEEKAGCLTNILVDRDNCGHCGEGCERWESCSNGECVAAGAGARD